MKALLIDFDQFMEENKFHFIKFKSTYDSIGFEIDGKIISRIIHVTKIQILLVMILLIFGFQIHFIIRPMLLLKIFISVKYQFNLW